MFAWHVYTVVVDIGYGTIGADLVCAVVNSTTLHSEIGNRLSIVDGINFALIFSQDVP